LTNIKNNIKILEV